MNQLWRAFAVAGLVGGAGACVDAGEDAADEVGVNERARSAGTDEALSDDEAGGAALEGDRHGGRGRYLIIDLPSRGGTLSGGNSINDVGWVTGFSDVPENEERHAALWRFGRLRDLGTLGGPNSSVVFPVKNNVGLVVGISETNEEDPLQEPWSCSAFFLNRTTKKCVGFAWENGVMRPLPTLGGHNGFAAGANNGRQIVGWAENTVDDPTCTAPQVRQFRAVLWGPRRDQMRELPPYPGDSTSAATAINDRGQVVGISGRCDIAIGRFSAIHAVIWENGVPRDIGNLGGLAWHTPAAINERGVVVGFSNHNPDDGGRFREHAFMWTASEGIKDLGTLPDETLSQALDVNERRDVVGTSCHIADGARHCRAFVWRDGAMTDLNTLVAGSYADHLVSANNINDFGVITGVAVNPTTAEERAYVAIPLGWAGSAAELARYDGATSDSNADGGHLQGDNARGSVPPAASSDYGWGADSLPNAGSARRR